MTGWRRSHPGRAQDIAWALLCAGLSMYMLLSAPALLRLGIPYDAPYGPLPAKIHPGSYVLVLAWVVALCRQGNPVRALLAQLGRHRALGAYFICMVLVFAWTVMRHGGSGAAYIIETLWMPAVAAFALLLIDEPRRQRALVLLMGLLACNAVLAIGEQLTKTRLTPLYIGRDDVMPEAYFRASAFLGHPLENALVTVTLLPAAALLPWPAWRRWSLAALLLLAMMAFGGRASLAVGALVYGGVLAWHVLGNLARGRYSYLQLTGGSLALVVGGLAMVAAMLGTSLGDRLLNSLQWDSSASVRLRVLDAFDFIAAWDLWFGISPDAIDRVKLQLGLDPRYEAIENFWVYLLMQFGVIGFVPFLAGLACLVAWLARQADAPMRAALVVYFVAGSTGNTLAAKTSSLVLLVTAVLAGAAARHGFSRGLAAAHGQCRPSAAVLLSRSAR